MLTGTDSPYSY